MGPGAEGTRRCRSAPGRPLLEVGRTRRSVCLRFRLRFRRCVGASGRESGGRCWRRPPGRRNDVHLLQPGSGWREDRWLRGAARKLPSERVCPDSLRYLSLGSLEPLPGGSPDLCGAACPLPKADGRSIRGPFSKCKALFLRKMLREPGYGFAKRNAAFSAFAETGGRGRPEASRNAQRTAPGTRGRALRPEFRGAAAKRPGAVGRAARRRVDGPRRGRGRESGPARAGRGAGRAGTRPPRR